MVFIIFANLSYSGKKTNIYHSKAEQLAKKNFFDEAGSIAGEKIKRTERLTRIVFCISLKTLTRSIKIYFVCMV